MHGGLLDIDTKRLELHLPIIDASSWDYTSSENDPYLPENIAQLCLECLERLDQETVPVGINDADLQWTVSLMLSPEEIRFATDLPCDLSGNDAIAWFNMLKMYMEAMFPSLRQLAMLGFLGYSGQSSPDSPIRFVGQGIIFEAVYRLTIHLCGIKATLQSAPKGNDTYHFQYRVLDDRKEGICSERVLHALVDIIPAHERATAIRTLQLAFKARNVLAHGAVIRFTHDVVSAFGRLFIKSIQCLMAAGLTHMTREAAYYR